MADMTMGQRIAEERKKLSLSQESLGEKMGVSRQAISKWESDGAVPEIDKLIVLSKLFGVSVGWLLGVEGTPVPADTLSDEQLYMIEEIVKKYKPKPVKLARLVWLGVGIVWTIVLLLFSYVYQLQNQRSAMDAYNSVYSQYHELHGRVLKLEEAAAKPASVSLFGDYSFEIAQPTVEDAPWVDIKFSAMPNLWREGDSAYLTVTREGMEPVRAECSWNGAWLLTTVSLEIADGYDYCVTIVHADGTQEQQIVTDHKAQNLADTFAIAIEITGKGFMHRIDPLTVTSLAYRLTMPEIAEVCGGLTWKKAELILVSSGGTELARHTLMEEAETDSAIVHSPEIASNHTEILFEDLQLPENEGILLWLRAELSNGLSSEVQVFSWVVDAAGNLQQQ